MVLAGLAACSSSGGASAAPVGTGDPVAARTHPCKLFTRDQANQALDIHVEDGKEQQGAIEPTCLWSGNPDLVATVDTTSDKNFDSELGGPVAHDYRRTSPVVGADSVWFSNDQDTISLLVIDKGYRYQLVLGHWSALGSEAAAEQRLLNFARTLF